jgi:hypothetical protein
MCNRLPISIKNGRLTATWPKALAGFGLRELLLLAVMSVNGAAYP